MYVRTEFEFSSHTGADSSFCAPTSLLFSGPSALLSSNSHLTENKGRGHSYNRIAFNQLRVAHAYISRKSFACIILQIGYPGVCCLAFSRADSRPKPEASWRR